MVKPEKFDHLHLVYHFTVPLSMYELLVDTSYQRIKYEIFKYLQKNELIFLVCH